MDSWHAVLPAENKDGLRKGKARRKMQKELGHKAKHKAKHEAKHEAKAKYKARAKPKKDIQVNGWDVSRTWEDEINMSDNSWTKYMQRVYIRIQGTCVRAQETSNIIGLPGKLKTRFTGSRKCYLIYDTVANCLCGLCKDWKKFELTEFQDSNRTYDLVALEKADMVREFDLCWNHAMKMGLTLWSRKSYGQERVVLS